MFENEPSELTTSDKLFCSVYEYSLPKSSLYSWIASTYTSDFALALTPTST